MSITILCVLVLAGARPSPAQPPRSKLVLVAGTDSHGKGEHEFNAGVQLLAKALEKQTNVVVSYVLNGWPKDHSAFDNADGILFSTPGGGGHAAIQDDHIQQLDRLAR